MGYQRTVDHRRLAGFYFAALVVALPHILRLPIWLTLFFVCVLSWRYLHERYGWYLPGRIILFVVGLIVSAAIYKHYAYLLGRDPGVALLFGLTGLKFFEIRNERDANVAVMLLFLLTLCAFLYSQSFWMGLYLVLAVVATTAALVRLNNPVGISWSAGLRLSATLLVLALPLALLVYFLFPRIQGSLWGVPTDARSGTIGLSEVMRPGSITELSQSDAIAFRAEFTGKRPDNRRLYWRSFVLWDTDGRAWTRGPEWGPQRRLLATRGQPQTYTITLEPTQKPYLVALDLPVTQPTATRLLAGHVLKRMSPVRERYRYQLTSYTQYNTGGLTEQARWHALRLPENLSPRVYALARQWRRESLDELAVARKALQFFSREKFVYTLKPPAMRADPVAEFLFVYRRGFCEHFAAAFVTLMRAAGIPSRVVAGYQGGEYNATGNYFIVRQANAHAWAEIWIAGRGWLRVDPTAAVAPERIELGIDAIRRLEAQGTAAGSLPAEIVRRMIAPGWLERGWRQTRMLWDTFNLGWYKWTADYDFDRQTELLHKIGLGLPTRLGLLIGVVVSVILFGFLLAVFLLRRRQHPDAIQAIYLRFCRKLARAGLARAPHEGALSFARRAARALPTTAADIDRITRLYLQLRYGDSGGTRAESELKRRVAALRPTAAGR